MPFSGGGRRVSSGGRIFIHGWGATTLGYYSHHIKEKRLIIRYDSEPIVVRVASHVSSHAVAAQSCKSTRWHWNIGHCSSYDTYYGYEQQHVSSICQVGLMGYSNVDPATCSTNTPPYPANKSTTFWWCSTSIKHRWIVSCLGRPSYGKMDHLQLPMLLYSMPTLLNHTIIHSPHTSTRIRTAHYRSMTTAMSCACAVGQAGIAFPWPASAADKGKDWRIRPQHIASKLLQQLCHTLH